MNPRFLAVSVFLALSPTVFGWGGEEPPASMTTVSLLEGSAGECGELEPDSVFQVFVDSIHLGGLSGCGSWLEIDGPADTDGKPRTIKAKVVGFYRGGIGNTPKIDVYGAKAWKAVTGLDVQDGLFTNVAWRFIEAPVGDVGIVVAIAEGTNPYFAKIRIENHRVGVKLLEISTKAGEWIEQTRILDGAWTWQTGVGALPRPFRIRLTDILGRSVESEVDVAYQAGARDTLAVQFLAATTPVGAARRVSQPGQEYRNSLLGRDALGRSIGATSVLPSRAADLRIRYSLPDDAKVKSTDHP